MPSSSRVAISRRRIQPWIGREMAGVYDVERTFASSSRTFLEEEHPSEILRKRSDWKHRLGELYTHMIETDTNLAGLLEKREDAVLGLPWRIEPGDASPQAREAAELCQWALDQIDNLDVNLRHQLGARAHGVVFDELVWEQVPRGPYAGAVLPVAMIDRPMHRFAFEQRTHVLRVRQATGEPSVAPPAKFLVSRQGSKDSPWGGRALLDLVYWLWFLKKHGWKFWAVFVEKWAMPTAVARYQHARGDDKANRERQSDALRIVDAIQSEYGVAIPEGLLVDLIEATRSGGGVSYDQFIGTCNKAMALLILGEINTSGLRAGVGAFASEKVSDKIRHEKVRGDAAARDAAMSCQPLRWITEANYGPDVTPPRMVTETLEAEDRTLRQEGMERVLSAGQPVPERDFYLAHQVRRPEPDEPVVERGARPKPNEDEEPEDVDTEEAEDSEAEDEAEEAEDAPSLDEVELEK